MNEITDEKLEKYFKITKEALDKTLLTPPNDEKAYDEIIQMVTNYLSDAEHFRKKGDKVNAFAALNYAHGWLDCGARLNIFTVKDSRLFTVDDE